MVENSWFWFLLLRGRERCYYKQEITVLTLHTYAANLPVRQSVSSQSVSQSAV